MSGLTGTERRFSTWVTPEWLIQQTDCSPRASLEVDGVLVDGVSDLDEDELWDLIGVLEDAVHQLQRLPVGRLDRLTNHRPYGGRHRNPLSNAALRRRGLWPYPPTDWTPPENALEAFSEAVTDFMAPQLRKQLEGMPGVLFADREVDS